MPPQRTFGGERGPLCASFARYENCGGLVANCNAAERRFQKAIGLGGLRQEALASGGLRQTAFGLSGLRQEALASGGLRQKGARGARSRFLL